MQSGWCSDMLRARDRRTSGRGRRISQTGGLVTGLRSASRFCPPTFCFTKRRGAHIRRGQLKHPMFPRSKPCAQVCSAASKHLDEKIGHWHVLAIVGNRDSVLYSRRKMFEVDAPTYPEQTEFCVPCTACGAEFWAPRLNAFVHFEGEHKAVLCRRQT